MNKSQLIDTIAERLELGRRQAVDTVEAVFETIQQAVVNGERVVISGFGVFEKVQRAARLGRNPATGEPVPVQETVVPKFRPGTEFKAYVSGAKDMAQTAVASARERVERTVQAAADQINWPMGAEGEEGAEHPDGAGPPDGAAAGTAAKTAKPASAPRASTRAPGSKTTRSTATKAASTRGTTRTSGTTRRTTAAGEKTTARRTSTTGTAKTGGTRATGTRAAGARSTAAKTNEQAKPNDATPGHAPGAANDGSSSG